MNLELIKQHAWKSMGTRYSHPDREPGYAFYHGQRVANIALQLRELIFPGDDSHDDVIRVAAWFHDVGKGIEPHWEYGAIICQEILRDYCSPSQLEMIVEIVGAHTLRKQKNYPQYVQLVQDADILDHYGSQEIWLNFWHTAYGRENAEYSLDFYSHGYIENVQQVRPLLNYMESVAFFDEKDRFVQEFVERFRREDNGELVIKQTKLGKHS